MRRGCLDRLLRNSHIKNRKALKLRAVEQAQKQVGAYKRRRKPWT